MPSCSGLSTRTGIALANQFVLRDLPLFEIPSIAIGVFIKRCSLITGNTLLAEARNLTIARMHNV